MADDGMLMNFDLGDAPLTTTTSFKGGRWKDRLTAKKVAKHRQGKAPGESKPKPQPAREIFKEKTHERATEDYIGPGIAPRAAKRQRVERDDSQNANRAAFASGKLPPGSISFGRKTDLSSGHVSFADEDAQPRSTDAGRPNGRSQDEGKSHAAFASGKLPLGSISAGKAQNAPSNKPGQFISSLFTFNPIAKTKFEDEPMEEAEPAKPTNAPLSDEASTFANLGLSRRLASHLTTKLDMKAPTAIQKATVPQMIKDDNDAFIQAQTGSGKTLAYLLPIVERIMAMSAPDEVTGETKGQKIDRKSGLFAVVLAPTRELCRQIAMVLDKLLRCASWIVGTTVIGGESKNSEKARLRKGVNILIATPGRLADHLDNTEVLNVSTVRWLVLDEGDRLMELGFEEEIKGIVEKIGKRTLTLGQRQGLTGLPNRRVTILCSATMKMTVQRLGEISLKDAIHIKADPTEEELARNEADGTNPEDAAFSAPAQLKQAYAVVPAKLRLVTLASILKRAFAHRGSVMKCIVFISCADSVDFHFSLFSRPPTPAEEDEDSAPPPAPAVTKSNEFTKDTIAPATAFSSETNNVVLHKLHGSLAQNIRTATLKAFTDSTEAGILICTDVASRGLDLPNIDYVIEYDPPFSADDHLHRVGRTARAGRDGRALIFLLPGDEEGYVETLASGYRDGRKSLTHNTADELIRKGFGGTGREWEDRATEYQLNVERWTLDSPKYLEMARRAYQSHIRAYATHVANERGIFNMQTLHLGHLAKAFALRDKPASIKVPGARPAKMTKADRSVAARKAARGDVEEKMEGERERKLKKAKLDLPKAEGDDVAKRMKRKMMEHMASASEFNIG